jgi:hypothetical protein
LQPAVWRDNVLELYCKECKAKCSKLAQVHLLVFGPCLRLGTSSAKPIHAAKEVTTTHTGRLAYRWRGLYEQYGDVYSFALFNWLSRPTTRTKARNWAQEMNEKVFLGLQSMAAHFNEKKIKSTTIWGHSIFIQLSWPFWLVRRCPASQCCMWGALQIKMLQK